MNDIHDLAGTRKRYDTATADIATPLAIVDIDAFDFNATVLADRRGGLPIRIASKSLRCRALLDRALRYDGFAGILAFSLREALWLHSEHVSDDIVIGYPSADRPALAELLADPEAAAVITLMIDDTAQLDLIDAIAPPNTRHAIRVCIDLDVSWRPMGLGHIGVRRSPVHEPADAVALARRVVARDGFTLVGMMGYEAQIAGIAPGNGLAASAVRFMQRRSFTELAERRQGAVDAVRELADLAFVNGGGTGSLRLTASDRSVTELTAGSGFYAPSLFDGYDDFDPRPAAAFCLPVVRKPTPDLATVHGGGWVASGDGSFSRLPSPWLPAGLKLTKLEGAGEVQTPLTGPGASALAVGDRVWFRHAKAGELCERVNELHLVEGDRVTGVVPTYRGEGHAFL
ncbi:amino acid deaminase/aldolase [Stackebrandtia soli]|uniref:amino acid deaminase/aldolase n=1 Tax=Stackebrandtia soli TaxID=1892856 RepID=UPI0039E9AFCF